MHIMSSASPEQARHGVPGSVVQRSVVLIGFTVGRVGIQSVSELLVTLVQLAGQHLIPVDEGFPKLGGRVPHLLSSTMKLL